MSYDGELGFTSELHSWEGTLVKWLVLAEFHIPDLWMEKIVLNSKRIK